jgi:hypothetical protein
MLQGNWVARQRRLFAYGCRLLLLGLIGSCTFWWRPGVAQAYDTCYAVADIRNMFVSLDKVTGNTTLIGNTGRSAIEALAFQDGTDLLYATDGGELGTINLVTGRFTSIGAIGLGNGSAGSITFDDIDGLSWDRATNSLYGVQRQTQNAADLLFQLDQATGSIKVGAFNGADYVPIGINRNRDDNIDDLSFNPITGVLYGVANPGGGRGTLIIIDKMTGAVQEVGLLVDAADPQNPIEEIEGLSFFNDGQLYGSTGDEGLDNNERNHLFHLDVATGKAIRLGRFPAPYADFEALACLTASIADDDEDGIVNAGEDLNQDKNLANDDTDGDGIPNYADPDDDGDSLLTKLEDVNRDRNLLHDDTDGDKTPNYLDADDDNDSVLTKDEDANQDGNLENDDQEGDGLPDYLEGGDLDGDGVPNQTDADDDGDGVVTAAEDLNRDRNFFNDDSDGDGRVNYSDPDDDGDSIPTLSEDGNRDGNPANDNADGDSTPNYLDNDADGGGYDDSGEWSQNAQDPLQDCLNGQAICFHNDIDGDGTPNFLDRDADNDGVPDQEELDGDANGDGIPNWLDATSTQRGLYLPAISRSGK